MSDYGTEYGQRVHTARNIAGLTQTQLAERLGLNRSSIANIEAGRQASNAEQVITTARALGCDPRWLLTGWDPTQPVPPLGVPAKTIRRTIATLRRLADHLDAETRPEQP